MKMAEKKKVHGFKRKGQKYKSFLVANLLLKLTDDDHSLNSDELAQKLLNYDIEAERHSISRDVRDLNELLNIEYDIDFSENSDEKAKLDYEVSYDPASHGYKIIHRPVDMTQLKLIADCIYSSKFITDKQADELVNCLAGLCSVYEIEELKKSVYTNGRTKTKNKEILTSSYKLSDAIKENKKVSFKYLKHTLSNKDKPIERRKEPYVVSPFKLMINDGNFYLLAFTDKEKQIRTYRLDRMSTVRTLKSDREGHEAFEELDMDSYASRVFSMFRGKETRVKIQFTASKLDTVIDRFGTGNDVFYTPVDLHHFNMTTNISVSHAFYSWLTTFGTSAVILEPQEVVDGYQKFLNDINKRYERIKIKQSKKD